MKTILKWIARKIGYEVRRVPPPARYVTLDETQGRDHGLSRPFATRAASVSASSQEMQAVRNLHLTGVLKESVAVQHTRVEIGDENTLKVGIWKKEKGKGGAFVRRSDRKDEWFYWANVERIEPKWRKRRVVLLGESVARGFLYDPHFNPAHALDRMLNHAPGSEEFDVVDLAKSNLTIEQLKITSGQCLALRPDVVVIFAGNNWRPQITEPDIPYVDTCLRESGVPGMKSFLDRRNVEAVNRLMKQVNSLMAAKNVKVVWVVPESNLEDWTDPVANAPHLPGQGNKIWRNLDRQAVEHFHAGDLPSAERLAQQMTSLDGGTSSIPLRILAECARSKGDRQATKRYFEMSRDAEGWDPSFSYSPRTSSAIQNAFREFPPASGSVVVDLPQVFSQHLGDVLPGRRMFLDYCHLTAEGVNVAMAAVASEVFGLLNGTKVSAQSIQCASPLPPPEIEGKASFLAAVHNAHFYQGADIVGYWCERALNYWPGCAELMTRFIDLQTRRVPVMACRSTIELFDLDKLGTLKYLLRGGKQRLELVLAEAVANCVKAVGLDIQKDILDLRVEENSIRTGPKELTDFYYSSAIPDLSKRSWMSQSLPTNRGSRSIFSSAFYQTSEFVFFGDRGRPAGLKFVYRIPNLPASNGSVAIDVNNHRLAEVPAGPTWQTFEISILGDHVVDGMNHITITWPDEEYCEEIELHNAADAIAARRLPYFYRVFGEIHALQAFDALECSANSVNYAAQQAS